MHSTRSFRSLCCLTQATLLNACITEADLGTLGVHGDAPSWRGFSPDVWRRAFLHKACQRDPETADRVSDLLDLRYLDTILLIRSMEEAELAQLVDLWVADPDGRALPGLAWALCTDGRDEASRLGARLCHEAVVASMRAFTTEEGAPAPWSGADE